MKTESHRHPAILCFLSLVVLTSTLLAPPAAGAEEDVLRPLTEEQAARHHQRRAALLEGQGPEARAGVPDSALTARLDEDSRQFIVPRFVVDNTNAAGITTLFAVRNTRSTTVTVRVDYFDDLAGAQGTESFTLGGFEILTRNVRDVPGLTSIGGFKTGLIIITGPPNSLLSVDVFQVDPGNDFATGSRALDVTGTYLCDVWDSRFLAGGLFSGGTSLNLLLNDPLGTGADDPSVVFAVSDEDGNPAGLIGLFTGRVTTTSSAQDVLDAIGPGAPAFGAFEVTFDPMVGGGVVEANYDADGRFSIGMKGTCLTP